jgi:hypothetical protein
MVRIGDGSFGVFWEDTTGRSMLFTRFDLALLGG